jgi:hypothetical protein
MTARLEKAIRELPPEDIERLTEIAEQMANRPSVAESQGFELKWAGALARLADTYDSVELQHKASEWRTGRDQE